MYDEEERRASHFFIAYLVYPSVGLLFLAQTVRWIMFIVQIISRKMIDFNPFSMYNNGVAIILYWGIGVLVLDLVTKWFKFTAHHRIAKNITVEIALVSLGAFMLISTGLSIDGNSFSQPHIFYLPRGLEHDPMNYIFTTKLGEIFEVGWMAFFSSCILCVIGLLATLFELRKSRNSTGADNSSLRFNAYAQAVCATIAGTAIAFMFAVIAYIRFEKFGLYFPFLVLPFLVALLCCVLAYRCGAKMKKIETILKYFDEPQFIDLMTQFSESEDDTPQYGVNPECKVDLGNDLKDKMVVDLIENEVLEKLFDNGNNNELDHWYCVNAIAAEEYNRLRPPQINEKSGDSKSLDKKPLLQSLADAFKSFTGFFKWLFHQRGFWIAMILAMFAVAVITLFMTTSSAQRKDLIRQYAENPEVQELVSNSDNGRVFVPKFCTDYTLLGLIDDKLLIASRNNYLFEDDVGDRWYTFDAALIEACQQAQNNTAEDVSPP